MDDKNFVSAKVRIRVSIERKEDVPVLVERIKNVPGIQNILPPRHIIALTENLTSEQIVSLGKQIVQIPGVSWVMFDFSPEEQKCEKH